MDYPDFVSKIIEQDRRNIFVKYTGSLEYIPDEMKLFYQTFNPIDVDIDCNGVGIRLYPAEKLISLQTEYSYLHAQFVFATCNGDPIFMHEGKIYTCPHGVKQARWELLARNIIAYFDLLVQNPK